MRSKLLASPVPRLTCAGLLVAAAATAVAWRAQEGGAAPAAAPAYLRLSQVGYPADAPGKRAYLMASGRETGATFRIDDAAGITVAEGPIGPRTGRWSARFPDVYAIDLPDVPPGTYVLRV